MKIIISGIATCGLCVATKAQLPNIDPMTIGIIGVVALAVFVAGSMLLSTRN